MKKLIAILLSLLLLGLISLALFLMTFDANVLRPYLAEAVYNETGKRLEIQGDLKTHMSLSPTIEAKKVVLFNQEGFDQNVLMSADLVTANVALLPLLKNQLVLNYISISGAAFNLEKNDKGQMNWQKKATLLNNENQNTSKKTKEKISLKQIVLKNTGFSLVDKTSDKMYQFYIASLKAKENFEGFSLDLESEILAKNYSFSVQSSKLKELFSDEGKFSFDVKGKGRYSTLSLTGSVSGGLKQGKIDAQASLNSKKIDRLVSLFGIDMLPFKETSIKAVLSGNVHSPSVPEFSIVLGRPVEAEIKIDGQAQQIYPFVEASANVNVTANNFGALKNNGVGFKPFTASAKIDVTEYALKVQDFVFKADAGDMSGSFFLSKGKKEAVGHEQDKNDSEGLSKGKNPEISINLVSKNMDLSQFLFVLPPQKEEKTQLGQIISSTKLENIFSNKPFHIDSLKNMNTDISVVFENLTAVNGEHFGKVPLKIVGKNGNIDLQNFSLGTMLSLSASADMSKNPVKASMSLKTQDFSLPMFLKQRGVISGTVLSNIDLSTQGMSLAQMASALKGHIFVFAKDIKLESVMWDGFKMFLPPSPDLQRQPQMKGDCLVINVPVYDGFISSHRQVALQTNIFNMEMSGNVNLENEEMNLSFLTGFKGDRVMKAISGTLSLKGRINRPSITFMPEKTIGKALTAGLQFLLSGAKAAKETLAPLVSDDACRIALNNGVKETASK